MVEASPRRIFANAHTYHINSVSVNSDQQTFMSADDLRINLWHLEITDQSFSILLLTGCFSQRGHGTLAVTFRGLRCLLGLFARNHLFWRVEIFADVWKALSLAYMYVFWKPSKAFRF